ncbi:MAG: hypothetical protein R6U57_00705 [Anaerolineales bacterium]
MKESEKLRILIPHWMLHNEEHADEFRRWAEGVEEGKAEILEAVDLMDQVNDALGKALETLGGPLEGYPHEYGHSHAHSHPHSHDHSHEE